MITDSLSWQSVGKLRVIGARRFCIWKQKTEGNHGDSRGLDGVTFWLAIDNISRESYSQRNLRLLPLRLTSVPLVGSDGEKYLEGAALAASTLRDLVVQPKHYMICSNDI